MGVRLYADLPASILPALFMVSDEVFAEAEALISRWHDCMSLDYEDQEAAHEAIRDHEFADELQQWELFGFGKWGLDRFNQVVGVPRTEEGYWECCGDYERATNPVAFDAILDLLKHDRAYRIDWELLRKECKQLTWS